jgi:hypothetical protein
VKQIETKLRDIITGSGVTDFIARMAYWIMTGKPTHINSRYWGSSREASIVVHDKAMEIGMIQDPSFKVYLPSGEG